MKLIRWLALVFCGQTIFTAAEVSRIVEKRVARLAKKKKVITPIGQSGYRAWADAHLTGEPHSERA